MKISLVLFLSIIIQFGHTQSYLVFETASKVRLQKYPIGSDIRVHFKGEPRSNWMSYTIWDLDLKANCIRVSDTYCLPLNILDGFDVTPIGGNPLSTVSSKFLIPWIFFGGVQEATRTLFKPNLPHLGTFYFTIAATTATAWIYSKLFLNGQKRLNKKNRLKLIDLTITKEKA